MTHISERVFVDDFVVPWLGNYFDPSSIETEYTLPSRRRVDVYIRTPFFDVVVEAENDPDSFDVGSGQALGYMTEVELETTRPRRPTPILAVPLDPSDPGAHREDPEYRIADLVLREFDGFVAEIPADPDA